MDQISWFSAILLVWIEYTVTWPPVMYCYLTFVCAPLQKSTVVATKQWHYQSAVAFFCALWILSSKIQLF